MLLKNLRGINSLIRQKTNYLQSITYNHQFTIYETTYKQQHTISNLQFAICNLRDNLQATMKKLTVLALAILLSINLPLLGQDSFVVSSEKLSEWAHFLASDEMKGRANGSVEMARAAGFIMAQFKCAGLKPAPGMDGFLQEFSFESRRNGKINERNVIGYLEGSDPILKNEYLIFSSHYDHMGIGRPIDGDSIYNGANDNIAGTATIMGLAHTWAKSEVKPKRSVLFIAFAAEEMGMKGSGAFFNEGPIPHEKIFLNMNMEMTGHCTNLGKQRYYLTGQGFTNFDELLDDYNKNTDWHRVDTVSGADRLMFASDNVVFAVKREGNKSELNIPAHTLCTHGGEDHIHRPNDEPEFMNYDNMADLVDYLNDLGIYLSGMNKDLIKWDVEAFDEFMESRRRR